MVIEPVTYYHREGIDYGVLALTLGQLCIVRDALAFDLDSGGFPRNPKAFFAIRDAVLAGIQHLEGREGDPDGPSR